MWDSLSGFVFGLSTAFCKDLHASDAHDWRLLMVEKPEDSRGLSSDDPF